MNECHNQSCPMIYILIGKVGALQDLTAKIVPPSYIGSFQFIALYVYIEFPLGSSRMELYFWPMGFQLLIHSGALQKIFSNISFASQILVFAPYVHIELPLGSSRSELNFLGYGIWAPYTFRSYDKKFLKSTINICFVVLILVLSNSRHIHCHNTLQCYREQGYRPKNRTIGIDVIQVDAPYNRNLMMSKKNV